VTRIAVIGAGIAGCAAVLALERAGLEVAGYEAHPDRGADAGAFLTLAGNGTAALSQLGVVCDAGFPLTALRLTDHTGTELGTRPLTGYRCLRRAELCRTLQAETVRRGIPLHHGRALAAVTERPDGVTATFADGYAVDVPLLIGADGLNSTLRPLIDPGVAAPRYAGQHVLYGYTRDAAPPYRPGRIDMVRGSASAFGYTVSPDGETFWFARVAGDGLPSAGTPGQLRAVLLPYLRTDATPAADIVAATGTELMVTEARDLPSVPRWYTDRLLLIGDAAHAASPATGQGAALALEDAVVLAESVRDTRSARAAFERYERLRRPRVEANIEASARLTAGVPPQR